MRGVNSPSLHRAQVDLSIFAALHNFKFIKIGKNNCEFFCCRIFRSLWECTSHRILTSIYYVVLNRPWTGQPFVVLNAGSTTLTSVYLPRPNTRVDVKCPVSYLIPHCTLKYDRLHKVDLHVSLTEALVGLTRNKCFLTQSCLLCLEWLIWVISLINNLSNFEASEVCSLGRLLWKRLRARTSSSECWTASSSASSASSVSSVFSVSSVSHAARIFAIASKTYTGKK